MIHKDDGNSLIAKRLSKCAIFDVGKITILFSTSICTATILIDLKSEFLSVSQVIENKLQFSPVIWASWLHIPS